MWPDKAPPTPVGTDNTAVNDGRDCSPADSPTAEFGAVAESDGAPLPSSSAGQGLWSALAAFARGHWLAQHPLWIHFYRRPLLWFAVLFAVGIRSYARWQLDEYILIGGIGALLACAGVLRWWGGGAAEFFSANRSNHTSLNRTNFNCANFEGLTLGQSKYGMWTGITMGAAVALLGNLYAGYSAPPASDSLSGFAQRQSQPLRLRCVIQSSASWRPNPYYRPADLKSEPWRTQWDVVCEELWDGESWQPVAAQSSLTAFGRIDDLLPGDVIELAADCRAITSPTNPGGFDFAEYFRSDGKFVWLYADSREDIELREQRWRASGLRLRAQAVRAVDTWLHRYVSLDQAPLAAALVFGQREQVRWEDQQELMATGTLHMLAISGMHVEIVAGFILLLAALFSLRHHTLLLAIVTICGAYAALAGGKPPVLRAVLVIAAFTLARTLGRHARLSNVLGLAGLVLLLLRTANVDNVGVHLSFLAVATIGVFVVGHDPRRNRKSALQSLLEANYGSAYRWWLLTLRSLGKTWTLSLWVWLLTCPLIWSNFHIVAPIAIPLNVLIAFPLMLSLIAGLLTALLGWAPPLGWLAGMVCGIGLSIIVNLVQFGASIPFGHLWLPAPPTWWMIGYYLTVTLWLLAFRLERRGVLLLLLVAWIIVGIVPFAFGPRGLWGGVERYATENPQLTVEPEPPAVVAKAAKPALPVGELRCTFLDVGHGTSVILELPSGAVWLYDAGRMGAADRSHQDIADALWSLPTARIDTLLISHADSDHYNAVRGLCHRFGVGRIVSTTAFWQSADQQVAQLRQFLRGRSMVEQTANAGAGGVTDGVRWQVLHPRQDWVGKSDNAASMCLLLEFAGKRVLLPGDLEGGGLSNLVELPARPCHVLMAPHHGSVTLDPGELVRWCQPELVVISGNHRATQPRATQPYQTANSRVAVTFREGAVQARITAQGDLSAWHWRGGQWQPLR